MALDLFPNSPWEWVFFFLLSYSINTSEDNEIVVLLASVHKAILMTILKPGEVASLPCHHSIDLCCPKHRSIVCLMTEALS